MASDRQASPAERRRAVALLGCLSLSSSRDILARLLGPDQPESVQVAAIDALAGYADVSPEVLLDRWRTYAPAARVAVVDAMLSRPERALAFLRFAEGERDAISSLDMSRRARLLKDRDEAVRALAGRLIGPGVNGARTQVVADYKAALGLDRDPKRGEPIFRRECAACHKVGDVGHAIGPDLTSSASRDAEALLTQILDPNAYVLPNYVLYQLADTDGRVAAGLIASQTAASVTLLREEGRTETIERSRIAELTGTGRSLMPEGFEARITKAEMSDLLAFLQSIQAVVPDVQAPLDVGTNPGLVEPERKR
jgi:putative heme-binding domain-containing protein